MRILFHSSKAKIEDKNRSKGGSQIKNQGLVLNAVTDYDKKFLIELRITDLFLAK